MNERIKAGFAMTGSFCTFEKAFSALEELTHKGIDTTPVMSFNAAGTDTRFGKAADHIKRLEDICGKKVIKTIEDAEPIGPKKMFDILIVAPCTANTAAKLALGITDTPVTMAVKSHVRNQRPVVIAISTNDALAACAKNIGQLQNMRNYYFVPYRQDDADKKPFSAVADMTKLYDTVMCALERRQIQPMI
ncbi:MAG: dipicolinate synthase subunit B [Ruminococcus sp.]|nr:dipicolinate synthase subunit B [Ruminococcus sp.]